MHIESFGCFAFHTPDKHNWLEYVFMAYVNHTQDAIWLTGFPDKPESLPHANDNYDRWLETNN